MSDVMNWSRPHQKPEDNTEKHPSFSCFQNHIQVLKPVQVLR